MLVVVSTWWVRLVSIGRRGLNGTRLAGVKGGTGNPKLRHDIRPQRKVNLLGLISGPTLNWSVLELEVAGGVMVLGGA